MGARQSLIWLLLLVTLLGGCADPARNLYEGIRNRNDAMRTPAEKAARPSPDYDQYRKEREQLER